MKNHDNTTIISFSDSRNLTFNVIGRKPSNLKKPAIGILQFAAKGENPAAGTFTRQFPKRFVEAFNYIEEIKGFSYLFTGKNKENRLRYFIFNNIFNPDMLDNFCHDLNLDYIIFGAVDIDNGFEIDTALFESKKKEVTFKKNYQSKNHEDILILLDESFKDIAKILKLKTGNFNYFENLTDNPMAFLFYCEAMSKLETRYLDIPYDPIDTAMSFLKALRFDRFLEDAYKKFLAICAESEECSNPNAGLELVNSYLSFDPNNRLALQIKDSLEKNSKK